MTNEYLLDTPFTTVGASSLATTPLAGTPEPSGGASAAPEKASSGDTKQDKDAQTADGDDTTQDHKVSLTEGGPGEEDEVVVHEVRAKALKLVPADKDKDSDSESAAKKSPWKTMGVGPLRILKHKTTGAVRLLLRAEPRGYVALNKALLPNFNYKAEVKYVKVTTASDSGTGLETWMLQVKTKEVAQALAEALEKNKDSSKE